MTARKFRTRSTERSRHLSKSRSPHSALRTRGRWILVVTRPKIQAGGPGDRINPREAEVIFAPVIGIVPLSSKRLLTALGQLDQYEGVVFTSVPGVEWFLHAVRQVPVARKHLASLKIGVVGGATSSVIRQAGLRPSTLPSEFRAGRLASELGASRGSRWLFPQAEGGLKTLRNGLVRRGVKVDVVPVYRTVRLAWPRKMTQRLLRAPAQTLVTCTSPSTVVNFLTQFTPKARGVVKREMQFVSIGPTTSSTLRRSGVRWVTQAKTATMDAVWNTARTIMRNKGGHR